MRPYFALCRLRRLTPSPLPAQAAVLLDDGGATAPAGVASLPSPVTSVRWLFSIELVLLFSPFRQTRFLRASLAALGLSFNQAADLFLSRAERVWNVTEEPVRFHRVVCTSAGSCGPMAFALAGKAVGNADDAARSIRLAVVAEMRRRTAIDQEFGHLLALSEGFATAEAYFIHMSLDTSHRGAEEFNLICEEYGLNRQTVDSNIGFVVHEFAPSTEATSSLLLLWDPSAPHFDFLTPAVPLAAGATVRLQSDCASLLLRF